MEDKGMRGKKLLRGDFTQFTPSGKNLFVKAGKFGKVPHYGDIVYFYSNTLERVAHTGIVIQAKLLYSDLYYMKTVEGNTSAGINFSRNGGEVAIKEYKFRLSEVGGTNRINGFGTPYFSEKETCTAREFVSLALEEVGYTEKATNKYLEDKKANAGDNNFTKYGSWYGGNGLYWCQQFVSWVAYMACKNSKKYGWVESVDESGEKRWKYKEHLSYIKGKWFFDDGFWYVFDNSGYMITGWFKSDNDWYYLHQDGRMAYGTWISSNNKSYYLTKTGVMAKNAYISDKKGEIFYFVNEKGEYIKDTISPDLWKYELVS